MKTFTYFKTMLGIASLASLACFTTNAQITINKSDMPQIGGVYISTNDTTPTVTPGAAGTNQT
jgi:hypothetical protein